ncbi:MAG: hypothetical protein RSB37_00980 [Acetivibrio sp.]
MKHILEFFHDVIPIVFVVGMLAIAFVFYNHTKNLAAAGIEKTYSFDEQLENADIYAYDGMTVSGRDVIFFAQEFFKSPGTKGSFAIVINSQGSGITTSDVSSQVERNASYICDIKEEKGVLKSATFTKK